MSDFCVIRFVFAADFTNVLLKRSTPELFQLTVKQNDHFHFQYSCVEMGMPFSGDAYSSC